MKRKEKLFIFIGLLLTVIICGGLYVNHQLDRLVRALSSSGLLFAYPEDETLIFPEGSATTPAAEPSLPAQPSPSAGSHPGSHHFAEEGEAPNDDTSASPGPGSINDDLGDKITAAVQQKLDRPLEKKDLLKAGLVILRKLNKNEINCLYRIGTQDSYTREELLQVREMLLAKLSEQDIRTLREIGAKYGRQLQILDPNTRIK